MVSPAIRSLEGSVRGNTAYDPAFQMQQQEQRQHDQWEEEVQNMSIEASEISKRLVTIRTQLVTISDKTYSASGAVESDVTDEEMQMAMEAQKIMKRLGEIKAKLSRKKLYLQSNSSRDSSLGVESSNSEGGHGRFATEGSVSAWNRPPSVLPSAVSLGTTPCMSSSFSTFPGYLNVTALSSESYSSLQAPGAIPEVIPRTLERQDHGITSNLAMEERKGASLSPPEKSASMNPNPVVRRQTSHIKEATQISVESLHQADAFSHAINNIRGSVSDSFVTDENKVFSLFERPKVTPWTNGTPGRLDHGIGVIVKPLRSAPTLEPIVSLDDSTSSELSPIPTTDDTSVNAFDYPLTKQPDIIGGVATPSLLDDTMIDTSSFEDSLEGAGPGVLGVIGGKDMHEEPTKDFVAVPSSYCQNGSIMDLFACGSHDLIPASDTCSMKRKGQDGKVRCCIEKAACDVATGRESFSVMTFLQSFKSNRR
jgi:hypothetical protein